MATAPKKTTTTRAKAPQDRKPKAVEVQEEVVNPEETPGWELMKDFADIPVWDQTPLLAQFQAVFESADKDENGSSSVDIQVAGDMAKALIPFAKDEAEFIKFMSGAGALQRAMNLVMAWVGQMGEFGSSES